MEETKENKLGTMPIGPLLVNVSVPIVISMLVQAMYNIVDSIFVARLGEDALTAVSLVFPVQNLMIAVGVGTGVGVGSLLSRRLGEKNIDAANKTAMNGLFLALMSALAFALFGIFGTGLFFSGYANHPEVGPEIAKLGADYMYIVTIVSPGLFGSILFERLLQSTGRSLLSMYSQLSGAIINIILDPIMIFGLLGFPALGVAGAALATVIGQFGGMFVGMMLNHTRNKELHLKYRGFRPDGKTIRQIYTVGLPSILMQSIGSVMVLAINRILVTFGSTPVSVFGVYFKLQSLIFMPVFGFNNGMVPIIAYNYGARKPDRIKQAIRLTGIICFCIMLAGTLTFWLIPDKLLALFNAQQNMMDIGCTALRIISLSFPIASMMITISGTFQALGQAVYSMIVSIVRQLVFLVPVAWAMSRIFGLDGTWIGFPVAEVLTFILSIVLFRRVQRQIIQPLYESTKTDA